MKKKQLYLYGGLLASVIALGYVLSGKSNTTPEENYTPGNATNPNTNTGNTNTGNTNTGNTNTGNTNTGNTKLAIGTVVEAAVFPFTIVYGNKTKNGKYTLTGIMVDSFKFSKKIGKIIAINSDASYYIIETGEYFFSKNIVWVKASDVRKAV